MSSHCTSRPCDTVLFRVRHCFGGAYKSERRADGKPSAMIRQSHVSLFQLTHIYPLFEFRAIVQSGAAGRLMKRAGVNGIPHAFIVDRTGNIVYRCAHSLPTRFILVLLHRVRVVTRGF